MQRKQLNPLYWMERVLDRCADWTMQRERIGVAEGMAGMRKTFWWILVRLAVTAGLMIAIKYADPWGLAYAALGGYLGYCCLAGHARVQAYRRGWLEGRRRMAENLRKHEVDSAGDRIMVDCSNWLDAEYNYDAHVVLGLPPTAPPR